MNIKEFKYNIDLIFRFVSRVNALSIPGDIKRTLVKTYANTLKINLTDNMVDSITENAVAYLN